MAPKIFEASLPDSVFQPVGAGMVTFAYEPPPEQSAEEFRKTFGEAFRKTLVAQIAPVVVVEPSEL